VSVEFMAGAEQLLSGEAMALGYEIAGTLWCFEMGAKG
jgi:hypothetical protein